ncbi:MAG: glutathione peroxidase [Bacteroidota bacterium]|jgi:glutathione peroxidase
MKLLLMSLLSSFLLSGSIYDFQVEGLDGETIDFKKFKGKKILIVNTASRCGLTPQYEGLEELYKKYANKLVIVGFPANNFMGQEPGSNSEIKAFCQKNYGVTFPMAEKVSVKGNDTHPLYKFLKESAEKKGFDNPVTWNFGKFLLDEKGELIATFSPRTAPMSEEITNWLK